MSTRGPRRFVGMATFLIRRDSPVCEDWPKRALRSRSDPGDEVEVCRGVGRREVDDAEVEPGGGVPRRGCVTSAWMIGNVPSV